MVISLIEGDSQSINDEKYIQWPLHKHISSFFNILEHGVEYDLFYLILQALQHLYLQNNQIGDNGAQHLAGGIAANRVSAK